ncbi:MAG TPA: hypothetical protein VFL42_11250 [Terriglobales bacterium]|nr:hypothetical protein [Terriglobales bacterium]
MNAKVRKAAYILAIGLMLTLVATKSSCQSSNESQQERFQRSFAVNAGATLIVENYKGTIHVAAASGNQVTVDVQKRFEGSESDRKWWMENVKVDFRNDPGRVEIKVDYPSCTFCWQIHDYTAAVELEIRVPRQINVELDGYKPDIKVSGIQGDLTVKSYKAPMLVEGTTGAVRIHTYKDTLRLRDVTIRGALVVKSYKADADITALSLGQSAEVVSEKGDVVIRVPANAGVSVDFEGGRRSSFSTDFALRAGTGYSGREVRGDINQGGSRLRLRTEKGSVRLLKIAGEL